MKPAEIYETWLNGNRKDARRAIEQSKNPAVTVAEVLWNLFPETEIDTEFLGWVIGWPSWRVD